MPTPTAASKFFGKIEGQLVNLRSFTTTVENSIKGWFVRVKRAEDNITAINTRISSLASGAIKFSGTDLGVAANVTGLEAGTLYYCGVDASGNFVSFNADGTPVTEGAAVVAVKQYLATAADAVTYVGQQSYNVSMADYLALNKSGQVIQQTPTVATTLALTDISTSANDAKLADAGLVRLAKENLQGQIDTLSGAALDAVVMSAEPTDEQLAAMTNDTLIFVTAADTDPFSDAAIAAAIAAADNNG